MKHCLGLQSDHGLILLPLTAMNFQYVSYHVCNTGSVARSGTRITFGEMHPKFETTVLPWGETHAGDLLLFGPKDV